MRTILWSDILNLVRYSLVMQTKIIRANLNFLALHRKSKNYTYSGVYYIITLLSSILDVKIIELILFYCEVSKCRNQSSVDHIV